MNWKLFAIGVAAMVLAASGAQAKGHHHGRHSQADSARIGRMDYSEPPQPIAYALVDAYLRASPHERATRDWSAGMAPATAPAATTTSSSAGSPPSESASAPSGAVNQAPANPPTEAAPPTSGTPSSGASAAPANPPTPSGNADAPSTSATQPPAPPTAPAPSSTP